MTIARLDAELSPEFEIWITAEHCAVLWDALVAGEIDAYPEYTGTLTQELLPGGASGLRQRVEEHGIVMSRSLGFSDSYAIGMKRVVAERLKIRTIEDLARHPELKLGFSNEFMDRKDGWPALRRAYGLPQRNVRGLDHDLAYRALADGAVDATDIYTTDAEIAAYDLTNPLHWRWHLVAVWFAVGVYLIAVGAHITAMLT